MVKTISEKRKQLYQIVLDIAGTETPSAPAVANLRVGGDRLLEIEFVASAAAQFYVSDDRGKLLPGGSTLQLAAADPNGWIALPANQHLSFDVDLDISGPSFNVALFGYSGGAAKIYAFLIVEE